MSVVRAGLERHPRVEDLKQLLEDIKREYLEIAVPAQASLPIEVPPAGSTEG